MVNPHSPYKPLSWLDLRVFYVNISEFENYDSTSILKYLTLNHVPLIPYAFLEANGHTWTLLRRDRVDKRIQEAIFVSTDNIRLIGSVKFEVFNKDRLIL
ncbi:hypothetical protein J1N35_042160 [Gossypium stocksii]|uniref:Uncharacterized protein n=1 Tax=Gossypium stocksii TaxID=47602 RepID=A0A9D3UH25_9ROSI|nr:hypothetical protein J1N35_042160 [Gossypium stocksii]